MNDRNEGRKYRKDRTRRGHKHGGQRHGGYHRRRDQSEDRRAMRKKKEKTRCPYCDGRLRAKGASDAAGSLSWKCRDCGRRVWKRMEVKPPVPLVPVSYLDRLGG